MVQFQSGWDWSHKRFVHDPMGSPSTPFSGGQVLYPDLRVSRQLGYVSRPIPAAGFSVYYVLCESNFQRTSIGQF